MIIVALLVAGLASGAGAFFWLHGREEPTKTAQPPVADAGVKRPRIELLHNTRSVVAVSSTVADTRFLPAHLVDGRLETAWNSRAGDLVAGWIAFRVPKTARVEAIELTVGFTAKNAKGDLFLRNHRLRKLEVFRGAKSLGTFDLDPALRMLQRITLPAGTAGGDFKLVVREVVPGTRSDWRELCVTELLVWGSLAAGEKPTPQQPAVFVGTLPGGSAALPTPTVEQSAATPLAERELSYTARLSPRDHQTPSGKPLRSAAMILQQDRANYHRFAQRDAEDEGDVVFGRRDARAWLGRIAAKQLSPAVARAIRSGTPKVRVTLRRGQLSVRVLSR